MALPKIDLPIYELKLPSNDKKVKFRPFTVKEEKILLIAQETKEPGQIVNSVKQIVNNCLIDFDVDDLAIFDLDYVLINIRSKSVDNEISFEIEDPDTKEKIKLNVDLGNVKVNKNENHTNKIKIDDEHTLFMKYPSVDMFKDLINSETASAEKTFEVLISCMDKLVTEEEVYNFKDFSKKEVDDFVESLHGNAIKKMKEFFDTIPKIRYEIPYVNSNGNQRTFVVEGIQSFFI